MTSSIRNVFVFILLFFNAGLEIQAKNPKTEILWDNYGVPHIYAQNAQDMYYAFGWAQMNNHANLMLKLYAQSRGCAAEYWGNEYFGSDKQILLFKIPELARTAYMKQNIEFKSYLDAFVKGINDFAKVHPEMIGEEFKQVLPVTVYDIISHTIRITCLEFLAAEDIGTVKRITAPGSNAIAIAPSKSASKNSMLITNPHLPWADYFIWFEAHLNSPGFNAYGIALVGMPSITMAFNDNLGWALTVNPIDASDRYELDLKEDGYLLDKKIVPFERKQILIKVRQDDGTLKELSVEFKYSKHGPVVGEKGKKAYAVRIAGLNNYRIFEQYHKMAKSKNLAEFESAVKMLQNPMFNIIYADKAGNILYVFNGNVPIRKEGDVAFWKETIDGTDSKYIWKETHPYEDLPKLLNPASGFLQNCNDPPWTCTDPPVLNPQNYPSYMAPVGTFMRPQRAVNMIKNNISVSFDQLVAYKLNTGMEAADRFLDDLLKAVEKYPDTTAVRAAAVLGSWDKKTEKDSRGAVLFTGWWDLVNSSMFEIPWTSKEPNTTPYGIKDQKLAVDLLVKAAGAVMKKYGSLSVAWGDVYRFRMYGLDYPANGGPGEYGIFRTIYFADDTDNKKKAIAGETYVAVIEFGKKVKANVLLSYGNATQPGSRHLGDQLIMLSEKKLRPALLEKTDIIKNLEKRESLSLQISSCNSDKVTMKSLLEEMTSREHLTYFPEHKYKLIQFSSHNPKSVAPEKEGWFANQDMSHFLRVEENSSRREFVLFDADGPGAIVRWWMTFYKAQNGILRIYIDNDTVPVIKGTPDNLLSGKLLTGPPLAVSVQAGAPLGEEGRDYDHNLYLPVPFKRHCKITYECDSLVLLHNYEGIPVPEGYYWPDVFYNIDYRAYEKNTRVESFSLQVLNETKPLLEKVSKDLTDNNVTSSKEIEFVKDILPGDSLTIELPDQMHAVNRLSVVMKSHDMPQALRSTVMQASFDGQRTVWTPIGEFFGSGYSLDTHKTWMNQRTGDGKMESFWIMPYREKCILTFMNYGKDTVHLSGIAGLTDYRWKSGSMYFGASWHEYYRIRTRDEKGSPFDLNFIDLTGKGVYAGDQVTLFNNSYEWWGEGDEKIFVDGETFPSSFGTGSEDYYGYSFGRQESFSHPFLSQPVGTGNMLWGPTINMRHRSLDAIPFKTSISSNIELWHWAAINMNYALTTYYYIFSPFKRNIIPDIESVKRKVVFTKNDFNTDGK